jgi:hypothetical protein
VISKRSGATSKQYMRKDFVSHEMCDKYEEAVKCTKDAENVYAPLVMMSIRGPKRTLPGKRVHHKRIDHSFDPPLFSLESTFNKT